MAEPNQKMENLLNLALEATEEERRKSLGLNVGFDEVQDTWEVIINYSGNLDDVREIAESVVELNGGYAIVTIREARLASLADFPQIIYIEKPKQLYFEVANGRRVSCVDSVQTQRFSLTGRGVLIGIIDSGIDYENADFRRENGSTRIRAMWDQTIPGNPPEGYVIGTEYTQEQIDEALLHSRLPSLDASGHGTAVSGIAAGNGRNSQGEYRGVATESDLIVVKLGNPRQGGFPRTTELMQALDYVLRMAENDQKPIAVNISFGNTYGSHGGNSLLERFIDRMADYWKNSICIGTGNEGAGAGHVSGRLQSPPTGREQRILLAVQPGQSSLNIQLWKAYTDEVQIYLESPSADRIGPLRASQFAQRYRMDETEVLIYYGSPSPYSISQEIYFDLLPTQESINFGEWQIILVPGQIVNGWYELWLPSENVLVEGTGFLYPDQTLTLTIPSTSARAVSVAAYDALTFSYADFSGRGEEERYGMRKPDLAAPGVNVLAPRRGGGYARFTGTSFATPFVTGSAALLMQWGIVEGNDPFLYGEKLKAYLHKGARKLPGFEQYPNAQVGYGALCVRDSIPEGS